MGKCKARTKKFLKIVATVVTPRLMQSGGILVQALAGVDLMSGHQKRAASIDNLKSIAKEEGKELETWAARAVNEYLFKLLVKDKIPLDDIVEQDEFAELDDA